MRLLYDKLTEIERTTSLQKGEYDLFALFLQEEATKWDILVSASWIENDKADALQYLASEIQNEMTKDEIVSISRIVIIDEKNPALAAFQQAVGVEHGSVEIKDSILFGLQIKQAVLITSRNRQAA